jgi:hypothetical protein
MKTTTLSILATVAFALSAFGAAPASISQKYNSATTNQNPVAFSLTNTTATLGADGTLVLSNATGVFTFKTGGATVTNGSGVFSFGSNGLIVTNSAGVFTFTSGGMLATNSAGWFIFNNNGLLATNSTAGVFTFNSTGLSVTNAAGLFTFNNGGLSLSNNTGLFTFAAGVVGVDGTNYGTIELRNPAGTVVGGFDTNHGGFWGFGNLTGFTNLLPAIVTVTSDTLDPNARRLAAGANITLTDAGPGSTLTVAATGGGNPNAITNNETRAVVLLNGLSVPDTGANSERFGLNADAPGTSSTAIGNGAINTGGSTTSLGANAEANDGSSVAIGESAFAPLRSVAIGQVASPGTNGVAIGYLASSGSNGVAIGSQVSAPANTVQLGNAAQALVIGGTGLYGPSQGITNLAYMMRTNGGVPMVAGSPGIASTYYVTNITADTTLAGIAFWANGASAVNLHCTVSGGTDHVLTFPIGCGSVQWGSPAAVTVTNAQGADFQVTAIPGLYTNVAWIPTLK